MADSATMKPVEILRDVRALLNDPEHWTQGSYAEDNLGRPRIPHSAAACCFCLEGAFDKVTGLSLYSAGLNLPGRMPDPEMRPVIDASIAVIDAIEKRFSDRISLIRTSTLVQFNDNDMTSIEDVHIVLDDAIAKMEAA